MDPAWLHFPDRDPPDGIPFVAAAVRLVQPGWWHLGLFHRREGRPVRLLHLEHHFSLKDTPQHEPYAWVAPPIPPERARAVAALCRLIANKHSTGQIPFGLRLGGSAFDPLTGALLLGDTEYGFTCATFVLAVFQSAGLRPLDVVGWPARPDDVEWQKAILKDLSKRQAPLDHIKGVNEEVGCVRFRPAEVAGAFGIAPWPVAPAPAIAAGQAVQTAFATRGSGPLP